MSQNIEFKRDKNVVAIKGNMILGSTKYNIRPLRLFCKELGADAVCTEILTTKSSLKFDNELIIASVEAPSKKIMADIEKNSNVKIINLLLFQSKKWEADVKAILKETEKPIVVSVPYDKVESARDLKVSGVFIHFVDKNGSEIAVDEKVLTKFKKGYDGKIFVKGKMDEPEQAYAVVKNTNIDGVIFSEFAIEKPTVFEQCKNYFEKGYYNKLTRKRREKVVARFTELYNKFAEKKNSDELNEFNSRFLKEDE